MRSRGPATQRVSPAPRRYEYYPDARVYFDPARQLYFFMEANRWAAKAFLPPQIKVRVGPPVIVDLDTERPYEYDDEVRQKYSRRHEDLSRGGYQKGFDDGYEEGYRDGFNAGYKESFNKAYQDGYRTCVQDRGGEGKKTGPVTTKAGRKAGIDRAAELRGRELLPRRTFTAGARYAIRSRIKEGGAADWDVLYVPA